MARIKQNLTERSKAYMQAAYLRRQLRMRKKPLEVSNGTISAQIQELANTKPKPNILEESILESSETKSQL